MLSLLYKQVFCFSYMLHQIILKLKFKVKEYFWDVNSSDLFFCHLTSQSKVEFGDELYSELTDT